MSTKILVVDDDPNICDLLRLYFENEGYEVKTASDGAEGVSFFAGRGMIYTVLFVGGIDYFGATLPTAEGG